MANELVVIAPPPSLTRAEIENGSHRPFEKEIYLFASSLSYRRVLDKAPVFDLAVGERVILKFDYSRIRLHRIRVYRENKEYVGYILGSFAKATWNLMEAGKGVRAKVESIRFLRKPEKTIIKIAIYLLDD